MRRAVRRKSSARRGVVVLVVVVVLAVLHVAIIASVAASGSDAQIGLLRVETTRAFYAAEGGASVVVKGILGQTTPPTEGSTLTLDGSEVEFVQVPESAGEIIVEGRSGFARRRLAIDVE